MTRHTLRRFTGAILAALVAAVAVPAAPAAAELRHARYNFQNFHSDWCVELYNVDGTSWLTSLQGQCPGSVFRPWYDPGTGTYRLTYQYRDSQCLMVRDIQGSWWVGTDSCTGGPLERWRFVHPGFSEGTPVGQLLNSTRIIQNVGTGECMSVVEHSTGISTWIIPEPCDRSYSQLWYIHAYV